MSQNELKQPLSLLEIEKLTIEKLEDALKIAMDAKRNNPDGSIYVQPASDKLNEEWCDADYWCCTPYYTNAPFFCLTTNLDSVDIENTEEIIKMFADEATYISSIVEKICKDFNVKSDIGWGFISIDADPSYTVKLFIKEEDSHKVKDMVSKYNEETIAKGYSPLTFNDVWHTVEGYFMEKPVKGGFFEKRKIKKMNKEVKSDLVGFLNSLHPYLRIV